MQNKSKGIIVGIDFGERYLGFAIAHEDTKIPESHSTIDLKYSKISPVEAVERKIIDISIEYGTEVVLIVVGYPVDINGEDNISSEKCKKFAGSVSSSINIPTILQNENFSSRISDSILRGLGKKRKVRDSLSHKMSASIILYNYFECSGF